MIFMMRKKANQKDGIDTIEKQLNRIVQDKDPRDNPLYSVCDNLADIFDEPLGALSDALAMYRTGSKESALKELNEAKYVLGGLIRIWIDKIEKVHPQGSELVKVIDIATNKLKSQLSQIEKWMKKEISPEALDLLALPESSLEKQEEEIERLPPNLQIRVRNELKPETPLPKNPFITQSAFRNLLVAKCLVSADESEVAEKTKEFIRKEIQFVFTGKEREEEEKRKKE